MVKRLLIIALIFSIPSVSSATVLQMIGFESGVTAEAATTAGTIQITNADFHSGGYSLRVYPTTTGTGTYGIEFDDATGEQAGDFETADLYLSYWFWVDVCPASGRERTLSALNDVSSNAFLIYMNDDCTLSFAPSDGFNDDVSPALSLSTWYHIEIFVDISADTYSWSINDTTVSSGSATMSGSRFARLNFGKTANTNGNTVDFFYDDIIIDDAAFHDNSAVIVATVPNNNGTYTGWNGGTGASDYTQVDDVPSDGNTSYVATSTPQAKISFAMTDTSTIGVTGTVEAVKASSFIAEGLTTANTRYQALTISGSTESTTTDSTSLTTSYSTRSQLFLTDPDTSSAWTLSGVDGIQVGGVAVDPLTTSFRNTQSLIHLLVTTPVSAVTINEDDYLIFVVE